MAMKGNYRKVPDTTKTPKFPNPRKEPNQYKEPIGPQKPPNAFERLSGAIKSGASNMMENARRDAGRHERGGGRQSNYNPLAMIAPPSYYGGMPGMEPERRERAPTKRRKRRAPPREREEVPAWQQIMAIPPAARRWMM